MKVCVVQPKYSANSSDAEKLFRWEMDAFDQCDSSLDLIVFPEACDVPALMDTKEKFYNTYPKYNSLLLEKAKTTAKRVCAAVFINLICETETGPRNTTYAINKHGEVVGHYYKQHLTPGETTNRGLDSEYSFEFSEPTIITIDGIRYGFLTCYDFYFYEAFANLARYNPDIIIGCSHQRSDSHLAVQIFSQNCAYNCNAYVVRSSVSMDEDAQIGGGSMVVAPNGEVLLNMYSRVGMECVDIDPKKKHIKPMGFGNPMGAHHTYIEKGRRPWKYRPAGSAIVKHDALMPYPRVCAHRGFNTIAPENSMPAFGAAVALGAEEIEFDLWVTADGEIVSIHDSSLERVSNGTGKVYEKTYAELLQYDFGVKYSKEYVGLKILTFEEILKKFSCHTIMNIHLKTVDNNVLFPEQALEKIVALIHKYDCEKYVYFMSGNDHVLEQLMKIAPHIARCCGGGDAPWEIVNRAIQYQCCKVQLCKPDFDQAMIDKAHENGIACNVFWSDDEAETKSFLEMGIDTILTNDYVKTSNVVKAFR